jgi:chromosome partitioning protein
MIILIGSQKGGCGKSTTAVNISAALVNKNKDVILVDADKQPTSANWCLDRNEIKDIPVVQCVQKYENIKDTLIDLNSRYEYVIVDTAGRDSRELRTAMLSADLMIIPFKPSQPDLDTLPKLQEVIQQAQDINPKLKVKALLTMCPTNPMVNEKSEAQDYLKEYPEISLLKSFICERKIYRDSMNIGKGAVELDNIKAKNEINQLIDEVLSYA